MTDPIDHVIRPGATKEEVKYTDDTGIIAAVRRRAYELWERDGRPAGHELDHWAEAEQEIIGQSPPLA